METPTRKQRKVKARRSGKPTNLYLNKAIVAEGKTLAANRYGCSLSELVERLLKADMQRKRGIAHINFGAEGVA